MIVGSWVICNIWVFMYVPALKMHGYYREDITCQVELIDPQDKDYGYIDCSKELEFIKALPPWKSFVNIKETCRLK